MSSVPTFSRPIRGWLLRGYMAPNSSPPITANCSSWAAEQSTLAPKSSIRARPPPLEGINLAIAGRSMPGRVLSTKRAVAMRAPVLPADTAACAAPSFTWLMATRMEEFFLFFKADCGASSMPTTSLACMICSRSCEACSPSALRTASSSPTRMSLTSVFSCRKAKAAGMVTVRPASPPMASMAKVII